MGKFPRQIVADVLAAIDIVDVIGASLQLKSAGSGRFVALCPFHQEKTPSFSISRDQQFYHCFGCGKHGDALSFLQEFEGLPFLDALQSLADRGGVKLPALTEEQSAEDRTRTRLFELGDFASKWFRATLKDPQKGEAARAYLEGRDLKPDTEERFGLGFAPADWDTLPDVLRRQSFSSVVIEASGLVRRSSAGKHYAFFRNRLMVPIRDTSGRVVAFGGRDLGNEPDTPKYINTPENPIYRKGRVLYGLFEAREALRREKHALLVEGYFDLMRCFDAGIENVVAPCGTALTEAQARILRRYVPEVVIVFDGDSAGVRAALRGVAVLMQAGLSVRALLLPGGQDPDDFIRASGAEAFRKRVGEALDFVSFYTEMSRDRLGGIEGRTEVAREMFEILRNVDDTIRQDEYLKRIAKALQIDAWAARREFEKVVLSRTPERPREEAGADTAAPVPKLHQDDCDFIGALVRDPALLDGARTALMNRALRPGPLAEVLTALFADGRANVGPRLETESARALFAAAVNTEPQDPERAALHVEKNVRRLQRQALEDEERRVLQAIREAERANDGQRVIELVSRKIRIRQEMEGVGAP